MPKTVFASFLLLAFFFPFSWAICRLPMRSLHDQKLEDMVEKCKSDLLLCDLPMEEYKVLMDTRATGRLSWLIDILRHLKVFHSRSWAYSGVFHSRSWAYSGVMTADKRVELLKRVAKDDLKERLSFTECKKIAKDLNLILEQAPLQPDAFQCGYFVMRYMRHIIEDSTTDMTSLRSTFKLMKCDRSGQNASKTIYMSE